MNTEPNLETVKSGIYKIRVGHPYGPPNIIKESNLWPIIEGLQRTLKSQESFLQGKLPSPHYFKTPQEFFAAWENGYENRTDSQRLDVSCNGFELQYITWDEKNPYFQIGEWNAVDKRGYLSGIIIVTDLNGLVDKRDWMSLGVNDFDKQRVLAYKPQEEVCKANKSRWKENTLIIEESPYSLIFSGETFPFSSKNALKSNPHTWSSIGFTPHQIYQALSEVGIKFPEDFNLTF